MPLSTDATLLPQHLYPYPALKRARYPFTAGWTERVIKKSRVQAVLNAEPSAPLQRLSLSASLV